MEDGVDKKSSVTEEDDIPKLSSHAVAALQEFLLENRNPLYQHQQDEANNRIEMLSEDWRLSQFWYDDRTASVLAEELNHLNNITGSPVACISCPSLYVQLNRSFPQVEARIFEYDERFSMYGDNFIFYDYNQPEDVPSDYLNKFQIVVADPPYLSEECLAKVSKTIMLLADQRNSFLLLLTGKVQLELAEKFLNMRPCGFQPMHENKLGNEFMLFTNYDPSNRLGGWIGSNQDSS